LESRIKPDKSGYKIRLKNPTIKSGCMLMFTGYIPDVSGYIRIYLDIPDISGYIYIRIPLDTSGIPRLGGSVYVQTKNRCAFIYH
jgi:hypothetical protein